MRALPILLAAAGAISLLAAAPPAKAWYGDEHPGWRDHHTWGPSYHYPVGPGYYHHGYGYGYGYARPFVRYGYARPVVVVRPPIVVVRPRY